jgi:hypothetical protein
MFMSKNWIKYDFDNGTAEVCKNGHITINKVPYLKKHREKLYTDASSYEKVENEVQPNTPKSPNEEITRVEDLSPEQLKEHKRLMGWSQEMLMLDMLYKKELITYDEMALVRQNIYDAYRMGRFWIGYT